MKKIELDINLLYEIYIIENHTIQETTDILNNKYHLDISFRTVKRNIQRNNFKKDQNQIQKSRESTIQDKYGVKNIMDSKEYINKIAHTKLERYGDPRYNNKAKTKQTNLKKYGVTCTLANKEIKERANKTLFNNFDTYKTMHSIEIKEKVKQTNLKKYGVPYYCMTDKCRNSSITVSKPNKEFSDLLFQEKINNELEFKINNMSYDLHILDTDILIELNPTPYHNITWHPYNKPKDKYYHYNKTRLANENNYRCIHIWDWDNKEKMINILKPKEILYARKLELKNISKQEANEFLDRYHLQNRCNGNIVNLGLYYNNELVQIMTFGKPRYNKNYTWELLRLCTNNKYKIVGGSKRLFKAFLQSYKGTIISYCDNSKFTGKVYNDLGFKLKSYGNPVKHWYNIKENIHITDNLLRQRGFDQLFNTNYGKGTSNEKLMLEHGFVEIYDCGQSTYIYKSQTNSQ